MVISKKFVKKSGFSYLELLFSLLIFINIFVLFGQIIYNIYKVKNIVENDITLSIELIGLRIESHFKEVNEYEIGDDYLIYYYRNKRHLYTFNNKQLIYHFNNQEYLLLENIKSIMFNKTDYFLQITVIDQAGLSYKCQIIIYE